MAFTSTGATFSIGGGLEFNTLYVRINVDISFDGTKVIATPVYYLTKDHYLSGNTLSYFNVNIDNRVFSYDRVIDGTDVLTFAHNNFLEPLRTALGLSDGQIWVTDL